MAPRALTPAGAGGIPAPIGPVPAGPESLGQVPLDLGTDARVRRLSAPTLISLRLRALLWAIGLAALLVPAVVVMLVPRPAHPYAVTVGIPGMAIPAVPPPPVEPVSYQSLSPDEARAWNARVPYAAGPNPAARPFRFALAGGAPDELARATDCLAAAAYYEAGDDPPGQRAVAQVVLNRLRHPAFPKTVCGVVFQGSERTTGCQFTFTCDWSLIRYTPTPDQWTRARAVAAAALGGTVFAPVGWATHYHTDWVVPYWQPTLDKLVAVHTQLFYRWTGWWGTAPAFDRRLQRGEPVVALLARMSEAHRLPGTGPDGLPLAPADADAALIAGALAGSPAQEARPGEFFLTLPPVLASAQWPALAQHLCGERERCSVMGWRDRARTPGALPLEPAQVAALSFSYLRDRAAGTERTLWNCRETPRGDPAQCMKQQVLGTLPSATMPAPAPSPTGPGPATADDLTGIRRRAPTSPTAATSPIVPAAPAKATVPPHGASAPLTRPARAVAGLTRPETSPAAAP